MRMKDDYMQNGQLKPGYNVQIATEGQYALAYSIFPNPTDTRTFIPFLNEIEQHYFELPQYIVADAGYGSEQNYEEILSNRKREALIPYTMYEKEQKKSTNKTNLTPITGHMIKKQTPIHARIRNVSNGKIKLYGMIGQASNIRSTSTNARTVQDVHSVHHVQKQRRHQSKMMVNEKWEQQKNI